MEEKPAVSMKSFCAPLEYGYPHAFGMLDALMRDFQNMGIKIHEWEDKVFPKVDNSSLEAHQEHLVRVITYRV